MKQIFNFSSRRCTTAEVLFIVNFVFTSTQLNKKLQYDSSCEFIKRLMTVHRVVKLNIHACSKTYTIWIFLYIYPVSFYSSVRHLNINLQYKMHVILYFIPLHVGFLNLLKKHVPQTISIKWLSMLYLFSKKVFILILL